MNYNCSKTYLPTYLLTYLLTPWFGNIVLRKMIGPTKDEVSWQFKYNGKVRDLYRLAGA
jgi:hypothetical protein